MGNLLQASPLRDAVPMYLGDDVTAIGRLKYDSDRMFVSIGRSSTADVNQKDLRRFDVAYWIVTSTQSKAAVARRVEDKRLFDVGGFPQQDRM